MKKILFTAIALASFNLVFAKYVQFNVNMNTQANSVNGIHVMGDFQSIAGFGLDFTPNTCTMVQDASDTDLYHFTVNLPAFSKYEYKFVNGDQSYEVEIVPLESQVGYNFDDNRWIYVDSLNADTLKLPDFVFGENCAQGLNMIRFKVDMTLQTASADGVHVAGSFQGNDPATTRMYSFGNNVYEIISYMNLGNQTYKYYNGNTLSTSETVPSTCAIAGERTHPLTKDTVLDNICFSSCATCYPLALNDVSFSSHIKVTPNPMSSTSNIQFNDGKTLHHIAIIDADGRIVKKWLNVQGYSFDINRISMSQGIFTLSVMDQSGVRYAQQFLVH